MKVRPLADRVVIKPKVITKRGAVIVPHGLAGQAKTGRIVAHGPGRWDGGAVCPTTLKLNDLVIFGEGAGDEVIVDNSPHLIMREFEVWGVVENDPCEHAWSPLSKANPHQHCELCGVARAIDE